eukprot:6712864-Prymnesium_polylepis.3
MRFESQGSNILHAASDMGRGNGRLHCQASAQGTEGDHARLPLWTRPAERQRAQMEPRWNETVRSENVEQHYASFA